MRRGNKQSATRFACVFALRRGIPASAKTNADIKEEEYDRKYDDKKWKERHLIVLLFYEKRSSCSCGCRLLAVTSLVVVFPCCSVLSTAPLRRRVSSLAVPKAFYSWMVNVGCVVNPWFPGACMFLTMWMSLIVQKAALSGLISMNWVSF